MDSSSSDEEVLSNVKRGRSSKDRLLDVEESDPSIRSDNDGESADTISDRNSDVGEESNEEKGLPQSESDENDERNHTTFEKKKKPPGSRSNDDQALNESKSPSTEASDKEDVKDEKTNMKTKKGSKSNGKHKDVESAKLLRLKKYLKVAGIKIQNYSKLFEGCKSKKSKEAKLLELLESKGLKGKPTLEKCKKLRKKIEREKEVAELDLDNIIDSHDGKSSARSARSRTTRYQINSVEGEAKVNVTSHKKKHSIFGNLHGIIDSEGSENDENNEERLHKQKRLKLIESDEES